MNIIEYLYPLGCNDLNFILFLIVTIVINDFSNTLTMNFGM